MSLLLKQNTGVVIRDGIKQIYYMQMRFSTPNSPGQSQGGKKRQPIKYGVWMKPGDRVDSRTIICNQKLLSYHPGLNVGINPRDKSLYAICAGTVYFSIERFSPNQANPLVQQFYTNQVVLKKSLELTPRYIKYVHVVPDKPTNEFKLIDLV